MLKSKNLKTEMAGAVLALGLMGAPPLYAQDGNDAGINASEMDGTAVTVQADAPSAWSIDPYNPEIPEGIIWFLAALAAVSTFQATRNKMEGAWMRAGAAGTLAVALANPQFINEEYQNLASEALIMVDISESQNLDGRAILTQQSLADLQENLDALGVNVNIVEFGDSADKPGTNLSDTLQASLNTIPANQLSAVFVLSDGEIHDAQTVLDRFNIEAPIHALISGHEEEQDFRISIENAPRYADANENFLVQYRITADHDLTRENYAAEVVIRNNGRVVGRHSLDSINAAQTVQIPSLAEGDNNIEISLEGVFEGGDRSNLLEDDLSTENNRITTTIEGVRDEINVLMITGAPDRDTRYLRQYLGSDPDINFVHFALLRPPEREDETPLRHLATTAFPVHEVLNDNINDYDLIILDNYTYNGVIPLAYFDNIRRYVEEGNPLLVSGAEALAAPNGLKATPLESILPLIPDGRVLEEEFIPQIPETGERYPLTRALEFSLPQEEWGPWYSIAGTQTRSDATVLLEDNHGNSLLATREHGEGRVAVLASDQRWLWDRLAAGNGGGPADLLTGNIIEWLLKNEAMDEENVTLTHNDGQLVVELQTLGDTPETLILTSPSGQSIEVTPEEVMPGLRRAFVEAQEIGVYQIERQGEHADFAFAQTGFKDEIEMREVISTARYMQPLADATGGMVARMHSAPDIMPFDAIASENEKAMGIRVSEEKVMAGRDRTSLPFWAYMMITAGFFAASLKREGGKSWKNSFFSQKNGREGNHHETPDLS
ncbi:MAG: hypothetical protein ACLFR0_05830 [Alphaproteobacteria bacterium]